MRHLKRPCTFWCSAVILPSRWRRRITSSSECSYFIGRRHQCVVSSHFHHRVWSDLKLGTHQEDITDFAKWGNSHQTTGLHSVFAHDDQSFHKWRLKRRLRGMWARRWMWIWKCDNYSPECVATSEGGVVILDDYHTSTLDNNQFTLDDKSPSHPRPVSPNCCSSCLGVLWSFYRLRSS